MRNGKSSGGLCRLTIEQSSTFSVDNFVGKHAVKQGKGFKFAGFFGLLEFCAINKPYKSITYDNISVA